jgi:hypothetical protein
LPPVDKKTWIPPSAPAAGARSRTRTATASSATLCRRRTTSRIWPVSAVRWMRLSRRGGRASSRRLSPWVRVRREEVRLRHLPNELPATCPLKIPLRPSPPRRGWTGDRPRPPCCACSGRGRAAKSSHAGMARRARYTASSNIEQRGKPWPVIAGCT